MCFPISVYKVRDKSMEPAFHDGDYVIVNRWIHSFNIGDVVVARHPTKRMWLLKRVQKVSKGAYFIVGDNKTESSDSRHFGKVDGEEIIGKVILKV